MGLRRWASWAGTSARWPARARSTRCSPGWRIGAPSRRAAPRWRARSAGADLVVVENLCSLPLNPRRRGRRVAACAGRPAVLHHHDLPWQRPHLAHLPPPPDDPAWAPRDDQRAEPHRAGRPRHRAPPRSTTPSIPTRLPATGRGHGRPWACADEIPLVAPTHPRPAAEERRRCDRAGRGRRRHLLAARPGRGRLRAGARRAWSGGPAARSLLGEPEGGLQRSPTPTPPATPSSCRRRGRDSATPRSSRRRTADRWPSARTPWRRSWRRSASTGSTPRDPAPLAAWLRAPDDGLLERNHRSPPSTSTWPTSRSGCPGSSCATLPGLPATRMTVR